MFKKILLIVVALFISGFLIYFNTTKVNPFQLKIRDEVIVSPKINNKIDGLLIGYFSDVRFNELDNEELFLKAVNALKDFKPDVIIFGGDMFSISPSESDLEKVRLALSDLKPRYGKYAVLGELDRKYIEQITQLYEDTNIIILDNDNVLIGLDNDSFINLIGLDLNHDHQSCFSGINSDYYTLVCGHYPDSFDEISDYPFDYMLAGHSLGIQLNIPLVNLFTRDEGFEIYAHGKTIRNGHTLDITNGVGMKERKARFLSDGEIVFYRLSH